MLLRSLRSTGHNFFSALFAGANYSIQRHARKSFAAFEWACNGSGGGGGPSDKTKSASPLSRISGFGFGANEAQKVCCRLFFVCACVGSRKTKQEKGFFVFFPSSLFAVALTGQKRGERKTFILPFQSDFMGNVTSLVDSKKPLVSLSSFFSHYRKLPLSETRKLVYFIQFPRKKTKLKNEERRKTDI